MGFRFAFMYAKRLILLCPDADGSRGIKEETAETKHATGHPFRIAATRTETEGERCC